jgi:outer membrane murein-binding lipoprotein Lpp
MRTTVAALIAALVVLAGCANDTQPAKGLAPSGVDKPAAVGE